MISSKLVLIVPILLAAVLSEDQLTCQEFVLMEEFPVGLATEISLIFIPSLLALLAVSFVSIFAYKLQLRLNREKQKRDVHKLVSNTLQASNEDAAAELNYNTYNYDGKMNSKGTLL